MGRICSASAEAQQRLVEWTQRLEAAAREAIRTGDIDELLSKMPSHLGLVFVADNARMLLGAGPYERALLSAYSGRNERMLLYPIEYVRPLFERASRARLREAGALPAGEAFTLYRGVAGSEHRNEDGLSWTRSLGLAAWFATRIELADPAVLVTEVCAEDVYVYRNDRQEDEFLFYATKWRRVEPMPHAEGPTDEVYAQGHEGARMMRTVALAVGIGLVVEALLPGTWGKVSRATRAAMVIGVWLIAYGLVGW